MAVSRPIGKLLIVLLGALMVTTSLLASGCVVEPREGFYDRDHHRWYHEHAWRDCGERDEHCHG